MTRKNKIDRILTTAITNQNPDGRKFVFSLEMKEKAMGRLVFAFLGTPQGGVFLIFLI